MTAVGVAAQRFVPELCGQAAGAGFVLGFDAVPGVQYEIQVADTLAGPFQTAGTVEAVGTKTHWCVTGFGAGATPAQMPQRYYRIRRLGAAALPP